jgi:hypothetical protein
MLEKTLRAQCLKKRDEEASVVADNATFRQSHEAMHVSGAVRGPIPGERDPGTLPGTQPGAVGGVGFGADLPEIDLEKTMDERTAHEHQVEGGGADRDSVEDRKKRT